MRLFDGPTILAGPDGGTLGTLKTKELVICNAHYDVTSTGVTYIAASRLKQPRE
jgi:hypothetical protein